jgi:hypothetical protein
MVYQDIRTVWDEPFGLRITTSTHTPVGSRFVGRQNPPVYQKAFSAEPTPMNSRPVPPESWV